MKKHLLRVFTLAFIANCSIAWAQDEQKVIKGASYCVIHSQIGQGCKTITYPRPKGSFCLGRMCKQSNCTPHISFVDIKHRVICNQQKIFDDLKPCFDWADARLDKQAKIKISKVRTSAHKMPGIWLYFYDQNGNCVSSCRSSGTFEKIENILTQSKKFLFSKSIDCMGTDEIIQHFSHSYPLYNFSKLRKIECEGKSLLSLSPSTTCYLAGRKKI